MKKMNKYTLLTIGIMVLFLGVFPATILAMHIPPGGGGPPPAPPRLFPYDYFIQTGSCTDGTIASCKTMDDGDIIHFKGSNLVLGVHFYFTEVAAMQNIQVRMKFKFSGSTWAFKIWIYYWDNTNDVLGGPYGFTPTHDWQIGSYSTDNYKAIADVYIWASGAFSNPEVSIDYLAVHY